MSDQGSDIFSLRSLLQDQQSSSTSIRESIEYAIPDKKSCNVTVFDEACDGDQDEEVAITRLSLPAGRLNALPLELAALLSRRSAQKTRWINFTGWSTAFVDDLSKRFLDDHGCLDLHDIGKHSIGGPIKCRDGSHFIWIQNSIWLVSHQQPTWSSVQQCGFRMVIKLPTPEKAGTIITTFTGKQEFVDQVSQTLTTNLLNDHSMSGEAMSCVWILAGSIMRGIITQLGLTFREFDPLDRVNTIPDMNHLPYMLHQANELARIDRYTSGLAEILGFFDVVREFQQSQAGDDASSNRSDKCYSRISERSKLETSLAKQQVTHVQRLCRTYIKQYESHTQMMLSYNSAKIAEKLERASTAGEKIAAVGVVLAAISGLTSPLAVVTGYFGMNIDSIVEDGKSSLFDFWSVAFPVFAFSLVVLGVLCSRLMLGGRMSKNQLVP